LEDISEFRIGLWGQTVSITIIAGNEKLTKKFSPMDNNESDILRNSLMGLQLAVTKYKLIFFNREIEVHGYRLIKDDLLLSSVETDTKCMGCLIQTILNLT
jgi:hypothetical protein